ncbi:RNA 2'-phosphotransferase [Cohnella sp. CFH 77786]|uniref:RNA 2'-phosphotransferase n=1 Tax=Cohnella sp. CFH 77786 TaxID=2662265 RepID=UPI001C60D1EC|nr:RNA 2'-phosphotransferase [Cohnella sp. CFH 77786]MBW5446041.1 RNA 2'-phosphotransferase [Cohnella sp. CFH 77786]
MDYLKLSKEVSYALRHAPWEYELELDPEGWVGVEQLIEALRSDKQWESLDHSHLVTMIQLSDKTRHEIDGQKIRALYGHSTAQKIMKTPASPPPQLYHGTSRNLEKIIMSEGLFPMSRQYVHLSTEIEIAQAVGKRKDTNPVILKINAAEANRAGIHFYEGNHRILLADHVPPQFISVDTFL